MLNDNNTKLKCGNFDKHFETTTTAGKAFTYCGNMADNTSGKTKYTIETKVPDKYITAETDVVEFGYHCGGCGNSKDNCQCEEDFTCEDNCQCECGCQCEDNCTEPCPGCLKHVERTKFEDDLHTVLSSLEKFLLTKNAKYGNSALAPLQVFSKSSSEDGILKRMDDKLSRIKNSPVLRKNDIVDLTGYLAILCINNGWTNFDELID